MVVKIKWRQAVRLEILTKDPQVNIVCKFLDNLLKMASNPLRWTHHITNIYRIIFKETIATQESIQQPKLKADILPWTTKISMETVHLTSAKITLNMITTIWTQLLPPIIDEWEMTKMVTILWIKASLQDISQYTNKIHSILQHMVDSEETKTLLLQIMTAIMVQMNIGIILFLTIYPEIQIMEITLILLIVEDFNKIHWVAGHQMEVYWTKLQMMTQEIPCDQQLTLDKMLKKLDQVSVYSKTGWIILNKGKA